MPDRPPLKTGMDFAGSGKYLLQPLTPVSACIDHVAMSSGSKSGGRHPSRRLLGLRDGFDEL